MVIKKNDILELQIIDYAFEGKGIAKLQIENDSDKKFVVFVNGTYPGDVVKAIIIKKKSSYAEAKVEEILKPSIQRVEPGCKHFGICGGCKQQDLLYESQLKYKQEQVKNLFEHLGGFESLDIKNIIGSEKNFFYRNKMEFSFADKRWLTKDEIGNDFAGKHRNFALGLHIPRIHDKVLDIDECFLQSKISNDILNFTREFFLNRNASIYSTKTHIGYLRNLVIKQSFHLDGLMVNLVTSDENDQLMEEYTKALIERIPQVTTVVNNINKKKSQVALGDYEKVFWGDGFIYDMIGKYKFRISANSFFQTNTLQAEKLYETVLSFADLSKNEIVYDLFSGAGTITIYLSKHVDELYAFESIESAIDDAKINDKLNDVINIKYFPADLNKSFLSLVDKYKIPKPTVLISDPPRSGMNPKTIKDILTLMPGKIVYVSCNPATQVRDIKLLTGSGYDLKKIQPIDMFPHTYHIENVALLIKAH